MPTIIDGITYYSEDEGRNLGHEKIKRDAIRIASRGCN